MLSTVQARTDMTRAQGPQTGTLRSALIFFVIAIVLLAGRGVVRALAQTRLQAVTTSKHRAPRAVRPGNTRQRQKSPRPAKLSPSARARAVATYARLPLTFEANTGQTVSQVKFISRGSGYTLFLTEDEAVLALKKPTRGDEGREIGQQLLGVATIPDLEPGSKRRGKGHTTGAVLRMQLVGANPGAVITGADQLPGKNNYFIGNNPKEWHIKVPTYAKVMYQGVYPGVDLVYYGNPNKGDELENDFVVAPGTDPGVIRLSLKGADHMSLDAKGDLLMTAGGGTILLHKPVVYQEDGLKTPSAKGTAQVKHYLRGGYKLGTNGQISFKIGAYDSSKPLIIDPVVSYATYLGGADLDVGTRVAVDSSGDAYITGFTSSTDFPPSVTIGQAIGSTICGVSFSRQSFPCPDAFVTKLSPDGQTIIYSTILGGSRGDGATGISVDGSGNVFLTGFTASSDFPVTSGAFQTTRQGESDAFVSKLNATGSGLLYSTFIGGSKDDMAISIATDSAGNASIAGATFSDDFPATQGSYQTTRATGVCALHYYSFLCPDAFVAKLNSSGSALGYATYLGGSSYDAATGIALDGSGSAYVTGVTFSTNFPTTAGTFQGSPSGATCGPANSSHPCTQAFVTKFSPTGDSLSYSTYFGGNGDTAGTEIAADSSGNSYFTGFSNATNLPTTSQSFAMGTCGDTTNSFNCPDAFVAKLTSSGAALSYMTYLGGTSYDIATDVRVDSIGDAYVVGATGSLDFPVTGSPVQPIFGGGSCDLNINGTTYNIHCPNAFLTILDTTGLPFSSTFLGGAGGDIAFGVAVDIAGNAYLSGITISSDFPVVNAEQSHLAGDSEAFVAKISGLLASTGTATLAPGTLDFGGVAMGDSSSSQDVTLSNSGGSSLTINSISITGTDSGDFSQTNTCGGSLAAGSNCTISVTFTPTATGSRSATLSVSDNSASSSQTAALSGTGQDFALTARTTSLTVAAGGTATYDLLLSPQGCFNQTVDLTCSGAPKGATCTVQPTSVTLDGSTDASFSVKVSTTGNAMVTPHDPVNLMPPSDNLPVIHWLALILLLGLIATVWLSKKGSPLRWALPFITLALMVTLWTACGGGSASTSSTNINATPSGTSTLTVTGTAGNLTHTTDLTLKVQ